MEEQASHAVIVQIKLSDDSWGSEADKERLFALEERLEAFFDSNAVGEFDGNEIGMGYWALYFYGPDADKLFDAITPILDAVPLPQGSYAIKQYGEPGATETRVNF